MIAALEKAEAIREAEEYYVYLEGIAKGQAEGEAIGLAKGQAEGEAIGLARGDKKRMDDKLASAKMMLNDGMTPEVVAKYTGLSVDQVKVLQ